MSRIVESLERLCEDTSAVSKLSPEIEDFMNIDSNTDYADQVRIIKTAGDLFFKELKDIKSRENDWNYIDSIREEERNFYKKYIDFAKKCREMSTLKGITGYGSNDFLRVKIMEMCRSIDHSFPYGWK